MSRLLLRSIALVLLCCGSLAAQDLGPLLPSGPSPLASQLLDRYALRRQNVGKLAGAKLASALAALDQPEPQLRLRGAKEIELYRTLSPAVALIATNQGMGSASLIALNASADGKITSGRLLTNAHVVGNAPEVAVIFKPLQQGGKVRPADALVGTVRKVDPVRDLALVEVAGVPANTAVLPLGSMKDVQVGADVHAIGHPSGQTWTYTKGLISQIRPGYRWQPEPFGPKHLADVIQTQTPINPGNSGGPLIDEGGRLIGVNSFKAEGEGLNFAVSVGEVEKFLAEAQGGAHEPKLASTAPKPCEPKVMYEGRSRENDALIQNVDMDCGGRVNATLHVPDDTSKPVVLRIDTNGDGKVDAWIFDEDRDGKPDLIGYHPDGKLKPSRLEKYRPKS
jgi:S1-C subfamily serine protease